MPLTPEERKIIIEYRLKRSEETWKEAKFLYENNMLSASVNRIYYSMFYAVNALAIENGFQTGKHTRLIGWFNKTYVKTGLIDFRYAKILSSAFDKRILGDYSDMPDFQKNEVENMLNDSKEFISMITAIIKTK